MGSDLGISHFVSEPLGPFCGVIGEVRVVYGDERQMGMMT